MLAKPVDAAMSDAVRRAIYSVGPLIAVMSLVPLSDTVEQQLAGERYTLNVLRVLSAMALGLAVLGLFAVMAYGVAQRMGGGVRAALGAMPKDLMHLVLARGVKLIAVGIAIGCAAVLGLTRLMQSLLYETNPHDPLVYVAATLKLLFAAILGCWLPAQRAMRVDIASLLRIE